MDTAHAPPISRVQQAALIAVMMAAFTEALTVAFNIGAIMARFGASGAEAGFVATAQGLCTAVAALTGTWLIALYSARQLVAAGLALALMAPSIAVLTPSFLGWLAVIDPSGKLAGAQPAFATLGGSMGPMTAGAVVDASGYPGLGVFVIAILIAALALMAIATTRADSIRKAW
jgi:MFS family permease